jgi:hypothetical protein
MGVLKISILYISDLADDQSCLPKAAEHGVSLAEAFTFEKNMEGNMRRRRLEAS